jgi:hypothetical protein
VSGPSKLGLASSHRERRGLLERERTAVVVVDVQEGFRS